ncbi:MAG: hypothetical protein LBE83_05140 [Propionibacteriaceae bacterium]|jgi:catechol 2,3-dioxygenase-like lactoylglutathione lyase family enzyme|nr:hypothetical protein [Propionibacteriaceae bacterium]
MAMELWHIGVPVTETLPGMEYAEEMKLWLNNPDEHEYKFELLKFEEGGPFPEVMHRTPHVAYKVDDIQRYLDDADELVFGPVDQGTSKMAFVFKDGILLELYQV